MTAAKGAATVAKTPAGAGPSAAPPAGLPRDPGAHVAKLRGQHMDDAQIRKALQDMGYSAADAKNVAPGSARVPKPASSAAAAIGPGPTAATVATPKTPRPAPATAAPAAAPASGRLERSAATASRYLSSPASALPGGVAGFLMGLGGTAVLINFMRGGTPGVRRWFAAKFMNVVTGAPTGAAAAPTAVTVSTTAPVLPGTTQWGQW